MSVSEKSQITLVPLYRALATKVEVLRNADVAAQRFNWSREHRHEMDQRTHGSLMFLINSHMPSGSGIDIGTNLDSKKTREDRLVFNISFHHMDEHGAYDGWTDHQVIVTPSLTSEFTLRITGKDRNDIKEYLYETFAYALKQDVDAYEYERREAAKHESAHVASSNKED
jgi:hypothetical protein